MNQIINKDDDSKEEIPQHKQLEEEFNDDSFGIPEKKKSCELKNQGPKKELQSKHGDTSPSHHHLMNNISLHFKGGGAPSSPLFHSQPKIIVSSKPKVDSAECVMDLPVEKNPPLSPEIRMSKEVESFPDPEPESDFGNQGEIQKREVVDVVKLRQLLHYCLEHDAQGFEKLNFYYECFPDRNETKIFVGGPAVVHVPVRYQYSKTLAELKLGRLYGYTGSFFQARCKFNGFQNMKKTYRGYLCEKLYWDIDMINAHASILLSLLQNQKTLCPPILTQAVLDRTNLLKGIEKLFKIEDTGPNNNPPPSSANSKLNPAITKNLLIRLMYGSTLEAWMKEFNLSLSAIEGVHPKELDSFIKQSRVPSTFIHHNPKLQLASSSIQKLKLLDDLLRFPIFLKDVALKMSQMKENSALAKKIKSLKETDDNSLTRGEWLSAFFSHYLQDQEKKILIQVQDYLKRVKKRRMDVFIHDGGLIRKTKVEMMASMKERPGDDEPPSHLKELLKDLNRFVQETLGFSCVSFANKPFDLTLCPIVQKRPQFRRKFYYHEWKHYLEEHKDLCWISSSQSYCLADRYQTSMHSSQSLRIAAGKYLYQPYEDEEEPHSSERVIYGIVSESNPASPNQSQKTSQSHKKLFPFIDRWMKDLTAREYDKVCFSKRTFQKERGNHLNNLTPHSISLTFVPRIRFIFKGWDLLHLPNAIDSEPSGEEEEEEKDANPKDKLVSEEEKEIPLPPPFADANSSSPSKIFEWFLQKLFPSKDQFIFVLYWVAHLFQQPDNRIVGTCLCLISAAQGTGKSTFLECIASLAMRFGRKITNVKEDLFGNFTTVMENNVLLAIDDCKSRALRQNYEQFKNLITSDEARIRDLYCSSKQIISNARFLVVSNNPDVLKLEEESRRFAVFQPSDSLVGNYSFFSHWNKFWSRLANRKAILKHILQVEIPKKWHPEQSYPGSGLKRSMELGSLSPLTIYVFSLAKTLLNALPSKNEKVTEYYFDASATILKKKFQLWFSIYIEKPSPKAAQLKESISPENSIFPTKNEFPLRLRAIGVYYSTDEEYGEAKKNYRSGVFFRIPLLKFNKRADKLKIEELESKEWSIQLSEGHLSSINSE